MIRVLIYAVLCEALVYLWFIAAPLQGIKRMLIRLTPFLYSETWHKHGFDCKPCFSVWVGGLCGLLYAINNVYIEYVMYAIFFARMSNYLHLVYSFVLDKQFDLRVNRRNNVK
jgi:hypothetical protein